MFEYLRNNNQLKREELIGATKKFIDSINEYPIFEIPDKLYLDYLKVLKEKLNKYKLKEDTRFVTYGRLEFLRKELTDRLHDENLKHPDPNWKDKWDNRMGAFWDLSDYIRGDRYISLGHVPEGKSFHDVLRKNDDYYKEGYICDSEKEILMEMINELEEYICQKNSKEDNEMGLFDKLKAKYNINPEDNMPQFVYGPPPFPIDKEDELTEQPIQNEVINQDENKKVKEDIRFYYFEGGYFGTSECYYVEKVGDEYKFNEGTSMPAGRNPIVFDSVMKTEEEYIKFITEIKDMVKDWKEKYNNPAVLDGTQWSLTVKEFDINSGGSNEFPNNYKTVKKFIIKNFKKWINTNNYEIDPEDNIPREVYGIPSPIQNKLDKEKDKYEVNPEKNVPQRVYGVPSPAKVSDENKNDKYDVEPQKNIPQKVYGVMNPEKFKLDLNKRNKESISVIINDYCLSLTKWGNTCDLLFMNRSKESFIKDSIISVSLEKFDKFVNRINDISSEWKNEYSGTKNIKWQIKFSTKSLNKTIVGNGQYPTNWNQFIDLISEYEVLFKKTIIYNNNGNNVDLNASFEEIVKAKVNDPFWEKVICDYFKKDLNKSDTVLKIIFKDLIKYEDIFNEFTKYLVQKTYDIPGAISVEGYTAKNIFELNPSFEATGVYTFLGYLREKPEEAKDIIKKGFPNKDAKPPVRNDEYLLKLVHTPLHGCYGTKEEIEQMKKEPIISYYKPELNKTLELDGVLVNVDEINHEDIKITIPFVEGQIADYEKYKLRQPTEVKLKINEKFIVHLDVYDAMETWEISFIKKQENNKDNELDNNSKINKLNFEKSKIIINETYIDENGHEVDKERVVEVGSNVILPQKNVTKDDWKTEPMPDDTIEFEMERILTDNEIDILKRGHKPEAMEDKWFWYVENNILNIHRSWTGVCMFQVELSTNGKLKVVSNRNSEQCQESDIENDKDTINKLLNYWTKSDFNYYEQFIEETHDNLVKQGLINIDN